MQAIDNSNRSPMPPGDTVIMCNVRKVENWTEIFLFIRISAVLSLRVGALLGTIFALTNDGRRINFVRYFFDGFYADVFVFLFWLAVSAGLITLAAIVSYRSIYYFTEKLGG
jgi:hypothetical protein